MILVPWTPEVLLTIIVVFFSYSLPIPFYKLPYREDRDYLYC